MHKKLLSFSLLSIFLCVGFIGINSTKAQELSKRYYEIGLIQKEDGKIALDGYNVIVRGGHISPTTEPKDFLAKLYSFKEEVLIESYFDVKEIGKFTIKLPYYSNGKIIKIFKSDNLEKELLEVNVQMFAKVCGDGSCQAHESYDSCPDDCPAGLLDGFCDHQEDEVCDPDCQNVEDADPDCSGENPATVQKDILNKINSDGKQATDNNEEVEKNKSALSNITNINKDGYFRIFAFFVVFLIIIFSIILFFLAKKEK